MKRSASYYRVQGIVRFWFWTVSVSGMGALFILADGYGRDWQ